MHTARVDGKKDESTKKQNALVDEAKKLLFISVPKDEIQERVLKYFSEYGYYSAFITFKREIGSTMAPSPLLKEREEIRLLSGNGKFLQVLAATQKLHPCLFFNSPIIAFDIIKQDIMEDLYIRIGSEGCALARVEKELSPIVLENTDLLPCLEELVSSILFGESSPEEVVVQRDMIFSSINHLLLMSVDYVMQNSIKALLMGISAASETPEIINITKGCKMFQNILSSLSL
ncbi:hypothetical protein NEIG_01601 [Nematocida sp. ERTm5]|nr:hypothetical protein NEIG_01601 [Nematocida sp. ERTm5]